MPINDNVTGSGDGNVSIGLGLDIQIGNAVNDASALADQFKDLVNDGTTLNSILSDTSAKLGEILSNEREQVSLVQQTISAETELRNIAEQRLSSVQAVTAQYTQLEQVMARIQLIAANTIMPGGGSGGGGTGGGYGGGGLGSLGGSYAGTQFSGQSLMGSNSPTASGIGNTGISSSSSGGGGGGGLEADVGEYTIGKSVVSGAKSIWGKIFGTGGATAAEDVGTDVGVDAAIDTASVAAAPETLGLSLLVGAGATLFGGDIVHGIEGLFGGGGSPASPTGVGAISSSGLLGALKAPARLAQAYTAISGGTDWQTALKYSAENEANSLLPQNWALGVGGITQTRNLGISNFGITSPYGGATGAQSYAQFAQGAFTNYGISFSDSMKIFTAAIITAGASVNNLNDALKTIQGTVQEYGGSYQQMTQNYISTLNALTAAGVTGNVGSTVAAGLVAATAQGIAQNPNLSAAQKQQMQQLVGKSTFASALNNLYNTGNPTGESFLARSLGLQSITQLPGFFLKEDTGTAAQQAAASRQLTTGTARAIQSIGAEVGLTGDPAHDLPFLENNPNALNGLISRLQIATGEQWTPQEVGYFFGQGGIQSMINAAEHPSRGAAPNAKTDSYSAFANKYGSAKFIPSSTPGLPGITVPGLSGAALTSGYIKNDPVLAALMAEEKKTQVQTTKGAESLSTLLSSALKQGGTSDEGTVLQQLLNGQIKVREGTSGTFTSAADITGYTGSSTAASTAGGNQTVQITLSNAAQKWLRALHVPANVSGA